MKVEWLFLNDKKNSSIISSTHKYMYLDQKKNFQINICYVLSESHQLKKKELKINFLATMTMKHL